MDLRQAAKRNGQGFTMIELLMVVTIIGILMAIAIPTFVGTRGRASDRATQTLVRNLLVSAKAADIDGTGDAAAVQADEPSLHVVAPDTEGFATKSQVSVHVDKTGGDWYVILASRSASGRCSRCSSRSERRRSTRRSIRVRAPPMRSTPPAGGPTSGPDPVVPAGRVARP